MKIITIKWTIIIFQCILFAFQIFERIVLNVDSWQSTIAIWALMIICIMLNYAKETAQ